MDRRTQGALGLWCAVVILFGAALAGAAFAATDDFTAMAFALLGHADLLFTPELRFAVALMGAVTFGWGVTIAAVASVGNRLSTPVAGIVWRRMTASVLVWFVIDSTLSIATGFALNAVSNAVLLAMFVVIVWRGRLLG